MYLYLLDTLNTAFALGGIVLAIITLVLYWDYYCHDGKRGLALFGHFLPGLIMATTTGTVAITLFYSEYFGFVPCSLCWMQRVALYPQAVMALVAYRVHDSLMFPRYGVVFSVLGLVVALYHYMYQMVPKDVVGNMMPCLADGTADCGAKIINEFGFVTFPLLSAIIFAWLLVLYLYTLKMHTVSSE